MKPRPAEYKAIVTRSNPGWSIYVPDVDRHTYAVHLREIEPMARDLIQVMTDLPLADITVAVVKVHNNQQSAPDRY